ncbi:MAG TPA: hypothetical protein VGO60_16720 [Iamia sp.]|nr:hypothetical protein [Iamia sp.]
MAASLSLRTRRPPPAAPGADRPSAEDRAPSTEGRTAFWRVAGPGLLVGLVSAAYGLSEHALWLDEAYSLGAIHQLGRTLGATSGTMSLYYLLASVWTLPSESVGWMRALSVVLAVAAIGVAVRVAQRVVGDGPARLAGGLTALSFLWFTYAREARSYALVMLLVAVGWLAVDHGLSSDDGPAAARRWWWVHTLVCAVAPFAHGLVALQVLPQLVVAATARPDGATRRALVRSAVATAASTLLLLVVGASDVGDWVTPLSIAQVRNLAATLTSADPSLSLVLLAVLLWGAVAAGRSAVPLAGRDRARALVPVMWAVVPVVGLIAVSAARPSMVPRYVVGSVPGVALVLAVGIFDLAHRHRRAGQVLGAVCVAILLMGTLDAHRQPEDGWTMARDAVAETARPGDALLFGTDEARPAFEAAWRDVDEAPTLRVVGGRALGEVRRFEDDGLPAPAVRDAAAEEHRVIVVANGALLDDQESIAALVHPPDGRAPFHITERWEHPDGIVVAVVERDGGRRPPG